MPGLVTLLIFTLVLLGYILNMLVESAAIIYSWFRREVAYIKTDSWAVKELVKQLKMKRGERLVELGCGNGVVTRALVREYPIQALGIEQNPIALLEARVKNWLAFWKKGRAKWVRGDFFQVDWRQADWVYIYLTEKVIQRLKLERLKSGARVIIFMFELKHPKFRLEEQFGRVREPIRVYVKI